MSTEVIPSSVQVYKYISIQLESLFQPLWWWWRWVVVAVMVVGDGGG